MPNDPKAARRHDAPERSQDFGATCAAMLEGNHHAMALPFRVAGGAGLLLEVVSHGCPPPRVV